MEASRMSSPPVPTAVGGLVAFGFGTTVAMWALGYLGRLPAVQLPSPLLLALLLGCLFVGGVLLAREFPGGWRAGAQVGLICGTVNLLVLGSFLGGQRPDRIVPSALWWIPGSIALSAACVSAGAALGTRWARRTTPDRDWNGALVRVAVAATLLLLGVGGVVTSAGAGLAVTDWPRSFGYNMFLYPFSRMTGDIYYEHAHRLFGALVGLTTLVMAISLQRLERRAWVRRLGWLALGMVIVQGVLGGLRVTGRLTLSASAESMAPNLALALVHGVFAQLFFATLVALAVFTSRGWRQAGEPLFRPSARVDRALALALVLLLLGQLLLGAAQRHFQQLLVFHVVLGVAFVAPLAVNLGIRSWSLNRGRKVLQRVGLALLAAICFQLLLGFGAFAVLDSPGNLAVRTAHQWFGAVVLALAVMLSCWSFRLLAPTRAQPDG